jgi:mono/diheme cytochrome c family protein
VTTRRLGTVLLGAALLVAALGTRAGAAEPAGDAARGRAVFEAKACARCHLSRDQDRATGPALEEVRRPQGILELAGRLWNHAPAMFTALGKEGQGWPDLGPDEMRDLAAYLQAAPGRDPAPDVLRGHVVLVSKGCLKCHRLRGEGGAVAMDLTASPVRYESPVAWATTIWGHAPRMAAVAARLGVMYPRFGGDEMANLFAFLQGAVPGTGR